MQSVENSLGRFGIREARLIRKAIAALRFSDYKDPITLLKGVFVIAFSEELRLFGSVREILDSLGSSDESPEIKFIKETVVSCASPSDALSVADVAFTEDNNGFGVFVFDGEWVRDLTNGFARLDTSEFLKVYQEAKRKAILRPSLVLHGCPERGGYVNETLTEAQQALIETADAYVMRGYNCQYDDSRFTRVGGGEFRWQISKKEPEDYTSARFGYVNCAAFSYELYRTALGMDLGDLYTTYNQMRMYTEYGKRIGEPMYPFFYELTHCESDEEKVEIIKQIKGTLRVGDLIVYRRKNGTGHVIVYVGDGVVVHSTGASYNYGKACETFEASIRYMNLDGSLFNKESARNIFTEVISRICIIRPLDKFCGEIPENTLNRVKNMRGITAERLSSVSGARTVNTGDIITYTYRIFNSGEKAKTLEIRDKIPQRVEYFDGEGEFFEGEFSKSITLGAGEEKRISYKVKVTGLPGELISCSECTVGGVLHGSDSIRIARTLTENEKNALIDTVGHFEQLGFECRCAAERVNRIYGGAGLPSPFCSHDHLHIERELLTAEEFYILNKGGRYIGIIAPGLYGGRNLQTQNLYCESSKECSDRVRLVRCADLVEGDVIIVKGTQEAEFMLYTGEERLRKLDTDALEYDCIAIEARLEGLLSAHNYFLVLRPSMAFKE